MAKKMKMNMNIFIVFVALSVIDVVFNAGAIILPVFGAMTESIQEIVNETIQILLFGYVLMLKK